MSRICSNILHTAVQLVARINWKGWLYLTAIFALVIINHTG